MSTSDVGRLYRLLPAIVRTRDDGFLEALMQVLEGPLQTVHEDIERLYDNWFIETCDEDIVPYIGDLVGAELLEGRAAGFSHRARVAHTLAYRRRKGTIAMLEQLARDVTGHAACAVEYFQRLGTTPHLDHVRLGAPALMRVSHAATAEDPDHPLATACHLGEVRLATTRRGRYNLPSVGLHLWRWEAVPVSRGVARKVKDGCYTFDPLGRDQPLLLHPDAEPSVEHRATLWNLPVPIDRREMHLAPERWYGAAASVGVSIAGTALSVADVVVADLTDWPRTLPTGARVAIDPVLGRLQLATAGPAPAVRYHTAAWGDIGAGAWDRRDAWVDEDLAAPTFQAAVSRDPADSGPSHHPSLGTALTAWAAAAAAGAALGVIVVLDDATYTLPARIEMPTGARLWIVAGQWPVGADADGVPARLPGGWTPGGARPHLRGDLRVEGVEPEQLLVEGMIVEGAVEVRAKDLARLDLRWCTVASATGPKPLTLTRRGPDDEPRTALGVHRCLIGAIEIDGTVATLVAEDSVIDASGGVAIGGGTPGGIATLSGCTVLGRVSVHALPLAEDCIVTGRVHVEARQEGCMRFSFAPPGSRTPRRYRCQPEVSPEARPRARQAATAAVEPRWLSLDPWAFGYARPARETPDAVRLGAQDEGEMGAFHFAGEPRREANLVASLPAYLRFGLEAGILFEDEHANGTRERARWPHRRSKT